MNYQHAWDKLVSLNQTHLLRYWDILTKAQKSDLLAQIEQIDVSTFYEQQHLWRNPLPSYANLEPFVDFTHVGNTQDKAIGLAGLCEGVMGCLIVAGGQGSRLQFNGPKGMYPVTPIRHKSLFQLFAEKALAASKRVKRPLNLAIMTSPENHLATQEFFKQHRHFGLEATQLSFFSQTELPLLDLNGQLFLAAPDKLAKASDGNGAALHCFYQSGLWENWQRQGIRYLNFIPIDNPLADPFDVELLGYQMRHRSEVGIKCALKQSAEEKVGVLAKQAQTTLVVEYSEMSDQDRNATDETGNLRFRCANLSLFCFHMDFVRDCALHRRMPLHKAFKKAQDMTSAESSMAWKFERFIFDVLPYASKIASLLYPRNECFSPLKNMLGENSLETVQRALQERDRHILGAITQEQVPDTPLELAQDFYYPSSELLTKWQGRQISQGGYIENI